MDLSNFTDEQLIKEFQNGNRDAYTRLVYKYKDRVLNFIYRYMGDIAVAEDLAQETFYRLYVNKDSYKEIAKFSTWLYTIAGNLAKTELRKIKRRKTYSVSSLSKDDREFVLRAPETEYVDEVSEVGQAQLLQTALLELDEEFRNIIILREIQELSYELISKILKLPLGTVKSRINRGKLKLREILKIKGVVR